MKTILVVEDFVAVQLFVRETLEHQGYRTVGAADGQKAYEMLLNHPAGIDMILTDYHMPGGNGYELLLKVKENPELQGKPVVFVTTETRSELISRVLDFAGVSWITKPYKSETLFAEIRRVLGQSFESC